MEDTFLGLKIEDNYRPVISKEIGKKLYEILGKEQDDELIKYEI